MRFLFKAFLCLLPFTGLMAQIQPKAITLKRFIEKCHYAPRPVDDSFSKDLYHKMLEELDPYRIYLDATQLKKLEPFQTTLDDELNGKPASFTKEFATTYHIALLSREKMARELLQKAASLPTGASSFNYGKNAPVAKDSVAMKQRWQQYLQWRILSRIYEKWELEQDDSAEAKTPAASSEWFTNAEKSAREGLNKRIDQRILEHEKGGIAETEKLVNEIYLRSIAHCFDPHTDYFDSRKQKEFSESLSSEVLEFGFGMAETEDGDIVITELKPGSAAWNSGNIYPDDKLVKIKTHAGKVINVKEDGYQTVSKVLDEAGKEEIELTLQSADGKIRQVKLQKNETPNEENLVRGYLLTGLRRMGYIALPSFYTAWGEQSGSGCANDLSKEILKLKREKIEGLILDLRYNGGGSLQEAIELAGIFIEAGPMTIVKESTGERGTLKDPSRGSIYDGPLMVLINGQSASASELVAGTLQDYKRAVVMGSPSFGKATMQMTLPMDTTILANRTVDEKKYNPTKKYDDYVNVTIGKIYRVSGNTNQLVGVKPDLELPDAFSTFDYTERSLDFALPSDTIVQKVPFTPLSGLYPANNFAAATTEINKSPYFEKLAAWVAQMKKRNEDNTIPLQWEAYAAYEASNTPPEEKAQTDSSKGTIKAENTSYTTRLLELESEWEKENNQWFLNNLLNDPYILSAYTAMSILFF